VTPRSRFDVTRRSRDLVVRIAGEIDTEHAALVEARLGELVDDGARSLVLDLDRVPLIDSAGLSALVHVLRRLEDEQGGRIRIRGVRDGVRKTFEITGLGPMFGLAPT
jgi:anti-anti-sigma factor